MISIPVIFSLRATHGVHTVTFTPWDKGDSEVYINKTTQVAYYNEELHLFTQLDYKAHDHIKITPWERDINHIATSRALSLGGELLPPHNGSRQQ